MLLTLKSMSLTPRHIALRKDNYGFLRNSGVREKLLECLYKEGRGGSSCLLLIFKFSLLVKSQKPLKADKRAGQAAHTWGKIWLRVR